MRISATVVIAYSGNAEYASGTSLFTGIDVI